MRVRLYRNHDATEWTTTVTIAPSEDEVPWAEVDVFGNKMILAHEFDADSGDAAREMGEAYRQGYLDGLDDIANAECPIHSGMRHGAEAEELRMGIEEILGDAVDDCPDALWWDTKLRQLLDKVDARDSLAEIERRKR